MTLPVFVVDTNVVVAGLITGDDQSPVARIVDSMLAGSIVYLLSPALLDEYRTVLRRPAIAKLHGLTEKELDFVLTDLVANAVWQDPSGPQTAPDPGDDHLWALLATRAGTTLITGDRLLLDHPPKHASAITPKTYVMRHMATE